MPSAGRSTGSWRRSRNSVADDLLKKGTALYEDTKEQLGVLDRFIARAGITVPYEVREALDDLWALAKEWEVAVGSLSAMILDASATGADEEEEK